MRAIELQGMGFSPLQVRGIVGTMAQTFTAAGTTQATATAISTAHTYITTASEGNGAILPASNVSDELTVCNSTAVDVYVYPVTGYKLNGATLNQPLMLSPNKAAKFLCVDGNNFIATW